MYRISKQDIQNHYYSCFHSEKYEEITLVSYSEYMMYLLKNNTWFYTFDNFSLLYLYLKITAVHKVYRVLFLYITTS
jgi:hypothetical protein